MSAKIRNAPSGENTNPQDSDAFPVTGSQFMQLSRLGAYVLDNVFDSDIQFTDNTTGNADSDSHGFLPKLSGDSDTWLDGKGSFTTPPDTKDHGALTGLNDDDHAQYLLASAAGSRTLFAINWTDLTDSGETTLHTHPASASGQYRTHATVTDSDSDNVDGWKFSTIDSGPVLLLTDLE